MGEVGAAGRRRRFDGAGAVRSGTGVVAVVTVVAAAIVVGATAGDAAGVAAAGAAVAMAGVAGPFLPGEAAPADSVEVYEELLSRGAAADESEAAALAGEATALEAPPGEARRWLRGLVVDIDFVAGYRVSQRLRAGWRRRRAGPSFVVVARGEPRGAGGYVEVRGAGPVARVVAGGVRPRFGQGLLLGARYLPFSTPPSAPARAGAEPTSSLWGRKTGGAVTVGSGSHGATVTGWREPDGATVAWLWWVTRTAASTFGAAAGTRGGVGGANVSAFVRRLTGSLTVATEVCAVGGRVFGVFDARFAGGGSWGVTLFDAPTPSGFSSGVAGPGDELRRQTGGALHRTAPWRRTQTRVTLYGSARRFAGAALHRRRFEASVGGRGGGGGGRWSVAVRLSERVEVEPSDERTRYRPQTEVRRDAQLRCAWTGGSPARFRQRYRLSAGVDELRRATAVVTVGWAVSIGPCEASCQVTNYHVGTGVTGYVIRPGLPGPDAVSAVSRAGTDVSARLRLRLAGARLGFFWDRRWGEPVRWYVSAGARR